MALVTKLSEGTVSATVTGIAKLYGWNVYSGGASEVKIRMYNSAGAIIERIVFASAGSAGDSYTHPLVISDGVTGHEGTVYVDVVSGTVSWTLKGGD